MRRGFKKEAKELALALRAELGLTAHSPLNPYRLAEEYGVRVFKLSECDDDEARNYYSSDRQGAFSGALIPLPNGGTIILENDTHSAGRRHSTLCHELSHVLLEHQFETTIAYDRKCGMGGDRESEADWLAGELLLPHEAALKLAWANTDDQAVAAHFNISLEQARWRMNGSGARKIVANARARRIA